METLNYLYLFLVIGVTLYFGAVTLLNYFTFKRYSRLPDRQPEPTTGNTG